ncbi:tryptophanyl-tRNA synthetase [Gigaspora margarita]|uniref:Tryptophan--tRNA ligase, mitochondrial n=1 Tax=Gigaspora margarita TaxID=4874 RepID=A0A8H3X1I6_GIGMA|nr:tryptophanyl-tRNA synthetase [Gigaspora margarita]
MNIGAAISRSIKRSYMSAGPRFPELILSGIQPTGSPHIGNFLGVLSKWVSLQQTAHDSVTLLYPIVDLHALTIPRDPEQLKKSKIETAIVLLACGIDPARSLIFEQSRIPAHTELAWFFNCITPMGWLSRMTQWKSKLKLKTNSQFSEHDVLSSSGLCLGLFSYPVLQAADILLYKATHVPIGEDQVQHLELTRDIAEMFNKMFRQNVFPLPLPITTSAKRIMSLYDPSKKMSKSDPENTRINMSDPPEIIAEKIKKSTSDSLKYITYDPETRPAIANLVTIYAAVQGITIDQVVVEHGKSNIKTFKDALTQVLVEKLSPIQKEIQRLRLEQGYVQQVLKNGAEKASIIAENNLDEIRRVVGLK